MTVVTGVIKMKVEDYWLGVAQENERLKKDNEKLQQALNVAKRFLGDIKEHDLYCGVNSCGHTSIDVMCIQALEFINELEK